MSVTFGIADRYGQPSPDEVMVAMDGSATTYEYQNVSHRLLKGQHVSISYRIGRSGNVYVDNVEPEGEAKQ